MPEYSIRFAQSARKELEHLDASVVNRVFPRIEALAQNPRPRGCRKLQGFESLWRIRVGNYRVIYQVLDDEQVVDIICRYLRVFGVKVLQKGGCVV